MAKSNLDFFVKGSTTLPNGKRAFAKSGDFVDSHQGHVRYC